jgi:hypothetical protein
LEKKASKIKLSKGEWPSGPPFGYKSIRGENNRPEHVPNEKTAPLVQQAFELFSTGNYSLQTLSDELYERGLRTKSGRPLSKELTKKLLQRKFYVGQLEWNGRLYEGKHKPIVSPEIFYRPRETKCRQRREWQTAFLAARNSLLQGLRSQIDRRSPSQGQLLSLPTGLSWNAVQSAIYAGQALGRSTHGVVQKATAAQKVS